MILKGFCCKFLQIFVREKRFILRYFLLLFKLFLNLETHWLGWPERSQFLKVICNLKKERFQLFINFRRIWLQSQFPFYNQFKCNAARFLAEGISMCAILLKIITLLAALFFVWRECQTWMNLPYCEMDICDGQWNKDNSLLPILNFITCDIFLKI